MKKKSKSIWVLIAVIIILVFPVRSTYKDGGTKTYTSLTYKVIIWNQLDGKHGMEKHIFPKNFHNLDYYDHD